MKSRKATPRSGAAMPPPRHPDDKPLAKKPTGIWGFDDITGGGLPENRLTSIIGSPGAGKTVFALQTLVNRLRASGEHGIFVTFEESVPRIRHNMASFLWGSGTIVEEGLSFIDARMPVDAILGGAFDLSALLAGLTALQTETGTRNIVFDGLDMLLASLYDEQLERQELARLDEWIRRSGLSALVTAKTFTTGERDQLRSDFLQYMTDCVIHLESRFTETTSTRTLRIVKYRGSGFAANPVPVVIGVSGFNVVALKSARLDHPAFTTRVSSGIPRLDALVDGGYIRGSSILISGSPGTSKTSLSANFAAAACQRGEKALFVSFDESGCQIIANMKSIGLDLQQHVDSGRLAMESLLSSGRSPEEHFLAICEWMEVHSPTCLVIDPLSSLLKAEYPFAGIICENLLDHAKSHGITVLCTSLLDHVRGDQELSASNVSTIADTWIHVSYVAHEGERNRALTIIKSRGTGHSNQVRELVLNQSGVDLFDVYVGEGEVLMGSARVQKEAQASRLQVQQEMEYDRASSELVRIVAELEARVEAANRELEWKRQESASLEAVRGRQLDQARSDAAVRQGMRGAEGNMGAGATRMGGGKKMP